MKINLNSYAVDEKDLSEVISQLNAEGGTVIIAEWARESHEGHIVDANFDLFENPKVRGSGELIADERGWKTPGSRDYRLHRIPGSSSDPEWDAIRTFFDKIELGQKYHFQIAGQFTSGRGFLEPGKTVVYVAPKGSIEEGLRYIFWHMMQKINCTLAADGDAFRFTTDHLNEIVAYALSDLTTGKVLRKNVQAGHDADLMLGM